MAPRGETRVRMIEAAYDHFRAHGYHGTSLADVTTAAGFPRGSFSFHFPGGKTELAREVVALAGTRVGSVIENLTASGGGVAALFDAAARSLRESEFGHGCAVAGVALDLAGAPLTDLARECGAVLTTWTEGLHPVLRDCGVPPEDCPRVARLVVILLEGAIVLARAQRDADALAEARDAAVAIVVAAAGQGAAPGGPSTGTGDGTTERLRKQPRKAKATQ